uniref:Apple domain-containing protein n=1 Tax=Romanomermis culicivorax TaxID=13658 RepID=A0A915HY20_ROMCU
MLTFTSTLAPSSGAAVPVQMCPEPLAYRSEYIGFEQMSSSSNNHASLSVDNATACAEACFARNCSSGVYTPAQVLKAQRGDCQLTFDENSVCTGAGASSRIDESEPRPILISCLKCTSGANKIAPPFVIPPMKDNTTEATIEVTNNTTPLIETTTEEITSQTAPNVPSSGRNYDCHRLTFETLPPDPLNAANFTTSIDVTSVSECARLCYSSGCTTAGFLDFGLGPDVPSSCMLAFEANERCTPGGKRVGEAASQGNIQIQCIKCEDIGGATATTPVVEIGAPIGNLPGSASGAAESSTTTTTEVSEPTPFTELSTSESIPAAPVAVGGENVTGTVSATETWTATQTTSFAATAETPTAESIPAAPVEVGGESTSNVTGSISATETWTATQTTFGSITAETSTAESIPAAPVAVGSESTSNVTGSISVTETWTATQTTFGSPTAESIPAAPVAVGGETASNAGGSISATETSTVAETTPFVVAAETSTVDLIPAAPVAIGETTSFKATGAVSVPETSTVARTAAAGTVASSTGTRGIGTLPAAAMEKNAAGCNGTLTFEISSITEVSPSTQQKKDVSASTAQRCAQACYKDAECTDVRFAAEDKAATLPALCQLFYGAQPPKCRAGNDVRSNDYKLGKIVRLSCIRCEANRSKFVSGGGFETEHKSTTAQTTTVNTVTPQRTTVLVKAPSIDSTAGILKKGPLIIDKVVEEGVPTQSPKETIIDQIGQQSPKCSNRLSFQVQPTVSTLTVQFTNSVKVDSAAGCAKACFDRGCQVAQYIPPPSGRSSGICLLSSLNGQCNEGVEKVYQEYRPYPFIINCIECSHCTFSLRNVQKEESLDKFDVKRDASSMSDCARFCSSRPNCRSALFTPNTVKENCRLPTAALVPQSSTTTSEQSLPGYDDDYCIQKRTNLNETRVDTSNVNVPVVMECIKCEEKFA